MKVGALRAFGNLGMSRLLIAISACLLPACATQTPIPDGTVLIGEVAHVLSRAEIVSGKIGMSRDNRGREPIHWPTLHETLLKNGEQDSDLVDGSVIVRRTQYYWHNVTSGIVRQWVRASPVAKGLKVSTGNVVELEVRGSYATVVRVKYRNLAEGGCEYVTRERHSVGKALDAINPIGGAGAASLYCPYLEKEGWVPNPQFMGIEWTKGSN